MTIGTTVFALFNGKMTKMAEPKRPERANFVIVCDYGDWSGFRTIEECQSQFAELEKSNRPNFYFRVVEA